MPEYEEINPTKSKQIITIVSGNVYNSLIKNRIVPIGRHKSISAYLEYLVLKDLDQVIK